MIERHGSYNDYEWLITFNLMGYRCGYVAIPSGHPLYEKDTKNFGFTIKCHNDITFTGHDLDSFSSDDWLIGFDCSHYPIDAIDINSVERYFGDNAAESIKDQFDEYKFTGHAWTADEVEDELKNIINQIINSTPDKLIQLLQDLKQIENDFLSGKYKEK